MAEAKKPTRRTTTAKKSTARKPAAKKTTAKAAPSKPPAQTESDTAQAKIIEQQKQKVDTYNALKEQGLPIPPDLRAEVEASRPVEAEPAPQQYYVRNLNTTQFRLKLDRHESHQRGIVLQRRGDRGDLGPIQPEDLSDPILIDNLRRGLVEVITEAEARNVVGKQTTNQQSVHPALAALRNDKGEEYPQGAVQVTPSNEEQAITVARIEDGQIAVGRGGIQGRTEASTVSNVRQAGDAPGTPDYVVGAEPGNHQPANEEGGKTLSQLRQEAQVPKRNIGGNPSIISDGFAKD